MGVADPRLAASGESHMARVVIADDHPLLVAALQATLVDAGFDVVGTTQYGADVVELVEATAPDVLLLDLQMPDLSGLDCLAALRDRASEVKVIVLSGADDRASIDAALALGAVCYVGKAVDPADLAATIRMMSSKAPIYSASGTNSPARARSASASSLSAVDGLGLTRRELEILKLAAEGESNGALARRLWVTEQTIKFHLSNIYRKLDVNNRTQAAAKAHALGITSISADEPATEIPGSA